MKNSFNNHGMNIIAHHYFNGKKDLSRIRYSAVGASNVSSSSFALDIFKQKTWKEDEKAVAQKVKAIEQKYEGMNDPASLSQKQNEIKAATTSNNTVSGYKGAMSGPNAQSATSNGTYLIRSMSELESVMKNGQSGQTLDLRDHRISPDVYAALSRGEAVEVQMQQMAPERVNLVTPLLASVMQIMGGMGGNVAYNKELSQVLTGQGNGDTGQLGKAADFVNKHGTAYDLGLGTGEHIDVVAQFRVLNQEGTRPPAPDDVPIKPIQYIRGEEKEPETITTTDPPKPRASVGVDTRQVTRGNTYNEISRGNGAVKYFSNFKAEYNKAIGSEEYLKPLSEQLGKDFDITEIKGIDGKVDPKKLSEVLKNLSKEPPITSGPYSKLLNQIVGSDKKQDIVSAAKNFTNYKMDISANTAFNNTARAYHVDANVGGVAIKKGELVKGIASGVEINEAFLRDDPNRARMTTDSLKSATYSNLKGDDGKPLFTKDEINQIRTGTPKISSKKLLEFFNRLERSMDKKYNPEEVRNQKVNLTKDALYGAVHQTNLQRSMIDTADTIAKGVTVIDKMYEGKPLSANDTKQLQDLVNIYNDTNSPPIQISDLKDKTKAVALLDFSKSQMEGIRNSITPEMKEQGQFAQLTDDINKVIETDSDTGIVALRNAIDKGLPLDSSGIGSSNTQKIATYQTAVTKEISDIESAIAKGATSIKVGNPPAVVPIAQYLGELKTKYETFSKDFDLPDSETKATFNNINIAITNAGKVPSGGNTSTKPGNAPQYQEGIKNQLNAMKSALDQGKTTIKIDNGNGQIQEKPILEYMKELEGNYQNFLLDASSTQEPEAITNMANLFSQVHLSAGLMASQSQQSVYNELRGTIGLALDADSRFNGKEDQVFTNITEGRADSDSINNKMIASVNIPALKTAFENTVNTDGSAKKPPTDLFNLIGANFTKFTEVQAKELITLSERLLKKAGIENVPDLTGLYETARKAGESIDQAISSTMAKAKELAPMSTLSRTEPLNISGGDFDNVAAPTSGNPVAAGDQPAVVETQVVTTQPVVAPVKPAAGTVTSDPKANALKVIQSLPDSDLKDKLLKASSNFNTSQPYSEEVLSVVFAKYTDMKPSDSEKIVSAVQGLINRPELDLMKVYNAAIADNKSPSDALMAAMDKAKEGKPAPLLDPQKIDVYVGTKVEKQISLAINYDIENPLGFDALPKTSLA